MRKSRTREIPKSQEQTIQDLRTQASEEESRRIDTILACIDRADSHGTRTIDMLNDQTRQIQKIRGGLVDIDDSLDESNKTITKIKTFSIFRPFRRLFGSQKKTPETGETKKLDLMIPHHPRRHIAPIITDDSGLSPEDRRLLEVSRGLDRLKEHALQQQDILNTHEHLLGHATGEIDNSLSLMKQTRRRLETIKT
jgi:hypothetical protein